jgi:hypothetical protein
MEKLNSEGQWIILMGFVICVSIFFLAILVNESTLVGQTTAESVLDFPKQDIQEIKVDLYRNISKLDEFSLIKGDIQALSLNRKHAIVGITTSSDNFTIHYNNGVTEYNETYPY